MSASIRHKLRQYRRGKEDTKKKQQYNINSSILEDLSDSKSELARFLFVDNENNDSSTPKSMGHQHVWFYELALMSLEERRERIIMIAEAQAIFGALFLTGSFVVYEWGSEYAYGGSNSDIVNRLFEFVMTIGITANLLLALIASFLWQFSIAHSSIRTSWVYRCRKMLLLQHHLITCVIFCTTVGCGLGIYAKFSYYEYWIELGLCLSFLIIATVSGLYMTTDLVRTELPLEYFHLPIWFKYLLVPFASMTSRQRKQVRHDAISRARELKQQAYDERLLIDPNHTKSRRRTTIETKRDDGDDYYDDGSEVGTLLYKAAICLGRGNFNVSIYEKKLEEDWFDSLNDLKDMSVDELSMYMPRKLAKMVYSKLHGDNMGS